MLQNDYSKTAARNFFPDSVRGSVITHTLIEQAQAAEAHCPLVLFGGPDRVRTCDLRSAKPVL